MSRIDLKEVDKIIEEDYRSLVSFGSGKFSTNDEETLKELIFRNRGRLKTHLEENNGMFGDFQYE